MNYCDECKERLYPMNPEVGGYHLRTKRYYLPLCWGCPHEYEKEDNAIVSGLEERISNLEGISATPGRIPREYYDRLQQLQGQLIFIQNKLNAALGRGKERAKQKQQITKPTYRGLGGKP